MFQSTGTRMSARPKAPVRRAGSVGVHSGSTDRKDSGSASMMPTSTSPTIRPPTGPEPVAVVQDLGLLEDVEPQRRLPGPPALGETHLLGGQRGHAEATGDGLAGGQPDGLAALQVAVRQRRVVGARLGPGDCGGQRDQRCREPRVDALGALGRRVTLDVDLQRPVDGVLGRDRAEAHQVGEHRAGAEVRVDLVAVADLGVAVAVGGVGELERDVGIPVDAIQLRAVGEQIGGQLRADEARSRRGSPDPPWERGRW